MKKLYPYTAALGAAALLASVHADGRSVSVATDVFERNLPGSAFGWTLREDHIESPTDFVDFGIMAAVDWIIPNNAGALGPGVLDRMAAERARIDALEPTGFSQSGAHHQWDAEIVPFLFDNAELIGSAPEEGYWATSWIGDDPGGNAEWIFRVEVDADSLQIWHWWNHGLGDYQLVTATLYDASGTELATREVMEHTTTIFRQFTSVIDVSGGAEGDYLEIKHRGTNVGWRGSAVLGDIDTGPGPDPDYGIFNEFTVEGGWALTGDWLGPVYVDAFPWIYINDMEAFGYSLGDWIWLHDAAAHLIVEAADGWVYFADHAKWAYESGPWYTFPR